MHAMLEAVMERESPADSPCTRPCSATSNSAPESEQRDAGSLANQLPVRRKLSIGPDDPVLLGLRIRRRKLGGAGGDAAAFVLAQSESRRASTTHKEPVDIPEALISFKLPGDSGLNPQQYVRILARRAERLNATLSDRA